MNENDVKASIYDWLSANTGVSHVFTITFDSDFVTGNTINASFNATSIATVNFASTHNATISALATAIEALGSIWSAEVTGAREITCTAAVPGIEITVVGPTVTGGATQPVATVETTTEAIDVTVIFANQNAPRPDKPYATILIVSNVALGGRDEQRSTDSDGIMTLTGLRRMTLSINIFGEGALDYMEQARNSLNKQTVLDDFFWADDIAIINKGEIQNLTLLLETIYEPRAQMNLTIGYAQEYYDDVGFIESVEVNDEIIDID